MSKIFGIVLFIGLVCFTGYLIYGLIDDIKVKKMQKREKHTEKVLSNVESDKQDSLDK